MQFSSFAHSFHHVQADWYLLALAQRLGIAELIIPAQTPGPPGHWHEMHDETFLVTQGTVRFHAPHGKTIDANVGDLVTVPVRAPHTFSNPGDQEARFINTFTPSFYINYFRLLSRLSEEGKPMSAAANKKAMANFATIVVNLKD